MDNTVTKNIGEGSTTFDRIASTEATSNCKQTPITDESSEVYEKQNLLLIENDNDIKY